MSHPALPLPPHLWQTLLVDHGDFFLTSLNVVSKSFYYPVLEGRTGFGLWNEVFCPLKTSQPFEYAPALCATTHNGILGVSFELFSTLSNWNFWQLLRKNDNMLCLRTFPTLENNNNTYFILYKMQQLNEFHVTCSNFITIIINL